MNKINLVSGLVFCLLVLPTVASADVCGQLAGVRGDGVEILRVQRGRAGQETVRYAMKIAEKSSTPLECDDVVVAGKASSARVILSETKISVGPESRVEIAAHSGAGGSQATQHVSLLNLTYGKMRALVNRKKDESGSTVQKDPQGKAPVADGKGKVTFEIRTFSAVAGVRGTDFYVSYDPNSGLTEQATIEGAVEVAQAGTQQKVMVESGKQVAVETTAQAVLQAQERLAAKPTGKPTELPKKLPKADEPVKPLKVVAIAETTREELRQTSAAAADDADFTSKKAVETLGQPSTWTLKREPLPDSLKKLKNEY